jgi:hypothetical protein
MGEKQNVYQYVLVSSIEFQVNEGWEKPGLANRTAVDPANPGCSVLSTVTEGISACPGFCVRHTMLRLIKSNHDRGNLFNWQSISFATRKYQIDFFGQSRTSLYENHKNVGLFVLMRIYSAEFNLSR